MISWLRRLPAPAHVALTTAWVALPLIVAVVALAQRRWYPVLDLAMTEFRVSDVGARQTPLIGLPGRIGDLPEQGSHPGPISFWMLAPGYRLFGGSAWAMEAATALLAIAWIAIALWIGWRRLGRPGVAMVALVVAVMIRGFGLSVLTQPWNPYLPLLAWLVVLLATWAVLGGDDLMLLPLVVAASFAAQTHIPYLTMAGFLGLVAFGVAGLRWWRSRDGEPGPNVRLLAATAGGFALLWSAPFVDQLRRTPGNLSQLMDHFTSPSEDAIGLIEGSRLALRHLDLVDGFGRLITGSESFVSASQDPDGALWPGLLLVTLWLVAAGGAISLRHRILVELHAVIAIALAAGVLSMSRIFGQRWFYLTLWAWVTSTLALVAIAWTAVTWWRTRAPSGPPPSRLGAVAFGVSTVLTLTMLVVAPSTDHPEEYLGETIGELLGPTEAALDPDASYVVEWKDAYFFGSQAFGLINELRRAGFDVGAAEFFRVPATNSRTKAPGTASGAIVFVTGGFVDRFRANEEFTEVAAVDPRSTEQRIEFDELRSSLVDDLTASGLDDLLDSVETNLFGLNVDQRISDTSRTLSARMIRLGQETAVFLGPPGTPP